MENVLQIKTGKETVKIIILLPEFAQNVRTVIIIVEFVMFAYQKIQIVFLMELEMMIVSCVEKALER